MEGVVNNIIAKQARQEIADTRKELSGFVDDIKRIDTLFKSLGVKSGTNSQVSQLQAEIDRLRLALEGVDEVERNSTKTKDALAKAEARLANIYTEDAQRLLKVRTETNAVVSAQRKQLKSAQAIDKTYQKLNDRYNRLNKEAQEAGARFGENSRQFKRAAAAALAYRKRLDSIDRVLKNGRRNVGRYNIGLKETVTLMRGVIGALGLGGGVFALFSIGRALFEEVKALDAVNKSLKAVSETTVQYSKNKAFLSRITKQYGVDLISTSKEFVKFTAGLKGTNLEGEKGIDIFEKTVKVSSLLGRSQDELSGSLNALTQIISKGTVQAEELRGQLGDRLPGAFNIMARALGVTTPELNKMLKAGEVLADEALPKFADELEKTFGADKVRRVNNLQAAQNRFNNKFTEFLDNLEKGDSALSRTISAMFEFGSATIDLITPTQQASNAILQERDSLNALILKITDVNTENIERQRLIDRLNQDYPFFIKNIDGEKSSNEDLTIQLDKVNKLYIRRLALQRLARNIEPLQEKAAAATGQNAQNEIDALQFLVRTTRRLYGERLKLTGDGFDENSKILEDELNKEIELFSRFEEVQDDAGRRRVARVKQALSDLAEARRVLGGSQTDVFFSQNDLDKQVEALKQLEEQLGLTADGVEDFFNGTDNEVVINVKVNREKAKKELKLFFDEVNAGIGLDEIEDIPTIDVDDVIDLDTFKIAFNNLTEILGGNQEDLIAEYKDLYGEDLANFEKFLEAKVQAQLESAEKQRAIQEALVDFASDVGSAIFEATGDRLDEEEERNDAYFQNQVARAEAESQTEEEKDLRLAIIEKQREKREEELRKKKKKIELKEFIFNKAVQAANVLIADGAARANALASTALLPFPANLAAYGTMQGIITLQTALSLASIAASVIPKFKDGTKGPLSQDTLAWIGDGGKKEPITMGDKLIGMSPAKATLAMLPKGAEVHSSENALMDSISANEMMVGEQKTLSSSPGIKVIKDPSINLDKTIRSTMGGWKFNNHINNTGVATAMEEGMDVAEFKKSLM